MAGRRRVTGRPLKSVSKIARRRAWLDRELAEATTPLREVTVAADYLRGAMATRPDLAREVAATVVRVLVTHADRLYAPTTTPHPTTERQAS